MNGLDDLKNNTDGRRSALTEARQSGPSHPEKFHNVLTKKKLWNGGKGAHASEKASGCAYRDNVEGVKGQRRLVAWGKKDGRRGEVS
jgi:hypothetical protein